MAKIIRIKNCRECPNFHNSNNERFYRDTTPPETFKYLCGERDGNITRFRKAITTEELFKKCPLEEEYNDLPRPRRKILQGAGQVK